MPAGTKYSSQMVLNLIKALSSLWSAPIYLTTERELTQQIVNQIRSIKEKTRYRISSPLLNPDSGIEKFKHNL